MRIAYHLCLLVAFCLVSTTACQSPAASTPPALSPVGLSGGALGAELTIVIVDEATEREVSGATITCGGASFTSAAGAAVRCSAADAASILVSAPGYVSERWIGIDHAHAVVGLSTSAAARTLHGEIMGATDRVTVGVSSEFGILRSGDVALSAMGCVAGADCMVALFASPAVAHDVAVLDHGASRIVLVRDIALDAADAFAVDVLAVTESEPLIDLTITLPSAVGLTEVVGVPGLSTANGVALLGSFADGTSTRAPAREASLAGDRLWFIAHARTEDGTGESFALDRDVPVGTPSVELPSSFLDAPIASRDGSTVTITRDAAASLYIVESSDAGSVVERALVFPGGSVANVPVSGTVRVRAVDAALGTDVDLNAIAAAATRFADRTL